MTADLASPLAAGMMTAALQMALRDREFAELITAATNRRAVRAPPTPAP
ncbi:hypothetical protein [Dactylosporangium sp. NPDC005555]